MQNILNPSEKLNDLNETTLDTVAMQDCVDARVTAVVLAELVKLRDGLN